MGMGLFYVTVLAIFFLGGFAVRIRAFAVFLRGVLEKVVFSWW
jgi:hypothetical protein